MTIGVTPAQRDVLAFVELWISEHGFSPTYAEIAVGLGLKSRSMVKTRVDGLVARGRLVKLGRQRRSLALPPAAQAVRVALDAWVRRHGPITAEDCHAAGGWLAGALGSIPS